MTAARGACVLALALSRAAGAEPCAPRASLAGDAVAVARVAAELGRLGVATTDRDGARSPSSCPTIVAAVELDRSGGIAVAVRDASQRTEGRVVSDPAVAAAWIESWARDDLAVMPPASGPPAPPPPSRDLAPRAPASRPLHERLSLAVGFERAWTEDTTGWNGLSAAACHAAGGWCVGARARYATGELTAAMTAARRTDVSGLATASYAVPVGRMSVAPELGLGLGRQTTARIEGCRPVMPPACDPTTDPTCAPLPLTPCKADGAGSPGFYVGDNLRATSWTPRLSGALRIALPLFEHAWLDGIAAVTYAPLGHAASYLPQVGVPPGSDAGFAIPGESAVAYQLGIGLRVGLP